MVTSRRAFIGYGSVLAGGFIAGWWSVGLVEYMGSASDTPWKTLTPDETNTLDRSAAAARRNNLKAFERKMRSDERKTEPGISTAQFGGIECE